MNDTVKSIIQIILIVLVLVAQVFFGIQIPNVKVEVEELKKEVTTLRTENAVLSERYLKVISEKEILIED